VATLANDEQSQEAGTKKRLLGSSAIFGGFTMLSRVLGLARDVVLARTIGDSASADAFYLAFKVPQFLRRLFAEGAFAQAFVPVLSEYRTNGSRAAVNELIDRTFAALALAVTFVTMIVVAAAPIVGWVVAPGYFLNEPEKASLLVDALRVTFPYLAFISLTAFAGSILNAYDRFAVSAVTPVFLNISLICGALLLVPRMDEPSMALAISVFIAGVVQFVFQLPFLKRLDLMPKPKLDLKHPGVRKIGVLMIPALFGVSVSQINLLFDGILASLLPGSAVSWLYYSDRIAELPLGVFGIAISTVILPSLSRIHSGSDGKLFSPTLDWGLKSVITIALPAMAAILFMAEPMLVTLFQYGEMKAEGIRMSAYSLMAYGLGLPAFMLIKVLATGYFSRQDTKTPVKIGVIAMVANMFANVAFMWPLHHFWGVGHVGLALATAFSAWLNAGLLYRGLRKQGVYQPIDWASFVIKLVTASLLMVAVLLALHQVWYEWAAWSWYERVLKMAVSVGLGAAVYLGAIFAMGVPRYLMSRKSAN